MNKKTKIFLSALTVVFLLVVGAQAVHSKIYYSNDNPSKKIINIITAALDKNKSLEVHEDISNKIEQIIPIGSTKDDAVSLLRATGYSINTEKYDSPNYSKRCLGVSKDEVIGGVRPQKIIFSLEGSNVTLCLRDKRVVDIKAWAFRGAY